MVANFFLPETPCISALNARYAPQFRRSSAVEQLTVNQLVVGSIPTAGANQPLGYKEKQAILRVACFRFCNDFATRTMIELMSIETDSLVRGRHLSEPSAGNTARLNAFLSRHLGVDRRAESVVAM